MHQNFNKSTHTQSWRPPNYDLVRVWELILVLDQQAFQPRERGHGGPAWTWSGSSLAGKFNFEKTIELSVQTNYVDKLSIQHP